MPHKRNPKQHGRPAERGGGQQQPTEQRVPLTIEAAAKGRPVEILVVYNHHKGGLSDNLKTLIHHEDTAIIVPEGDGVVAGLEDTYNAISQGANYSHDRSINDADIRYYQDFLATIKGSNKNIMLLDTPASPTAPSAAQTRAGEQQSSANALTEVSSADPDDVLRGFLDLTIRPSINADGDRERAIAQGMKDRETDIAATLKTHFDSGKKRARIIVIFGYMHQGLEAKIQGKLNPREQMPNLAIKGTPDDPEYKNILWRTEQLTLAIKQGRRVDITTHREDITRALFENIVHMFLNPDLSEEAAQQLGVRFPVRKLTNYDEAIRYHSLIRQAVEAMSLEELNEMLLARSQKPLAASVREKLGEILTGDARRNDPVQTLYRNLL